MNEPYVARPVTPEERERLQNTAENPVPLDSVRPVRGSNDASQPASSKPKGVGDLMPRLVSGAIYVVVCLVMVMVGETTTVILISTIAGICAFELFNMLREDGKAPNDFFGIAAAVLYPICMWRFGLTGASLVTIALLISLLAWYVFHLRARVGDVSVSLFGAAYTGLLISGLLIIREAVPGLWGGVLLVFIFASVWANDAFAYLAGSMIGKHKMAPKISPNKSWEGFAAGMLGSVAVWCLMTLIPGVNMSIVQAIVFGLICGLADVLGDLCESRIKRNSGVKDSGTIMPGHGGLLDRCDSLFAVSIMSAICLIGGGCIPYVL